MSLLELNNVSKEFGAIRALHDVSINIEPGEIVGLMGDNGAGKSTLVKIISGIFAPTRGETHFEGSRANIHSPSEARRLGIETVYQDLALSNNLTAAANIFMGRELTWKLGPFQFLDHAGMKARSAELFDELKSETRADDLVQQMSGGQRQAVAIARTRLADAKLIIMDEPTAAISVRQVEQVLALIKRLQSAGISVILVSHRMPDVFDVCDRVIVMRRGSKVADKDIAESSPEEVTALITGAKEAA